MSAKRHRSPALRMETATENIRSKSVLFSRPEIERANEQAKALRSQFFRENHKLVIRGLPGAVVVCALVVMVAFGGRPASQIALEGTVLMEQLINKLETAKTIAPETVREISQLLQESHYDCNQLTCDAALKKRNRVARDHLKSVVSRGTFPSDLAKNSQHTHGLIEGHHLSN